MPVDLALPTNTPTATLELRQVQPLGDGSHLAAFLIVRSGAFAAALPVLFTRADLIAFVDALAAACRQRTGVARLASRAGEDVLRFEAGEGGTLRIAGRLHDPEDVGQHLEFGFAAEWDGVVSIVDGLGTLIAATE